jgi:hypothetical protein
MTVVGTSAKILELMDTEPSVASNAPKKNPSTPKAMYVLLNLERMGIYILPIEKRFFWLYLFSKGNI